MVLFLALFVALARAQRPTSVPSTRESRTEWTFPDNLKQYARQARREGHAGEVTVHYWDDARRSSVFVSIGPANGRTASDHADDEAASQGRINAAKVRENREFVLQDGEHKRIGRLLVCTHLMDPGHADIAMVTADYIFVVRDSIVSFDFKFDAAGEREPPAEIREGLIAEFLSRQSSEIRSR
jgi:hypothetical protein